MRKFKVFLLSFCLLVGGLVFMSAVPAATGNTDFNVLGNAFEERFAEECVKSGYATEADAEKFKDSHIVCRSMQAFVQHDLDPKAAVDEAAKIAVEQGWAKSTADAKKKMRQAGDYARHSDKCWSALYSMLGL